MGTSRKWNTIDVVGADKPGEDLSYGEYRPRAPLHTHSLI